MNRIRRFMQEHAPTSGEKALAVMFLAGILGLWAGSNLSPPSEAAGLGAAAVVMLPARVGPQVRPDAPVQKPMPRAPDARYPTLQHEASVPESIPEAPPMF